MIDPAVPAPPAEASPSLLDPAKKGKKKKDRVRSAWISFVGRIIAQVVGAAASIALGVMVLQKSRGPDPAPAAEVPKTAVAVSATTTGDPPALADTGVAVLPLENFSSDPSQDFFADGMTEALIADLAQIKSLRVISRTSVMQYKGAKKPIQEIARELGVQYIVEGSVTRAGDSVRVTAQLIEAQTDRHVWARNYTRTARDVLALQADVAAAIAKELRGALAPDDQRSLAGRRPIDPRIYDAYLKGRQALRRDTQEAPVEALAFFEQAIASNPNFAPAHAGIADTYVLRGMAIYRGLYPPDALEKGRAAAKRALELDPRLPQAHAARATLELFYGWDWKAAEQSFKRALELNPSQASSLHWYAVFLAGRGRDAEAVAMAKRAVALDPLSAMSHRGLAFVHYLGRRYAEAEAAARQAFTLDPQSALSLQIIARSLILQGKPAAAIEVIKAAPKTIAEVDDTVATLAWALRASGDQAAATTVGATLAAKDRPAPPPIQARLHAALGNVDAALMHLERAITDRSAMAASLTVDPIFDNMRKDPRFVALLKKAGLAS